VSVQDVCVDAITLYDDDGEQMIP